MPRRYCDECGRRIDGRYIFRNDWYLCGPAVVQWARDAYVFACCARQSLPGVIKLIAQREIPEIADVIWSFLLMDGRVACSFRSTFIPRAADGSQLLHLQGRPDGSRLLPPSISDCILGTFIPPSISDCILEYLCGKIARRGP